MDSAVFVVVVIVDVVVVVLVVVVDVVVVGYFAPIADSLFQVRHG